jgi:23S rRNA (guanine745-N1)-methyltransferase
MARPYPEHPEPGAEPLLTDVLPYLRCPRCHRPLAAGGASLRCSLRHTFNIARQGYADLAAGPLPHGDTPAMVAAREAFLATGGYDFLAAALAAAATARAGLVVDVGGGTGYHLARVLDALPAAVGLVVDAAKPALRRAARAHPRAAAVRADAWHALPVADGAASVLLDVFAPRQGAELHRVLAPDGLLLVATPTAGHLAELYEALGSAPGVRLLRVDPEKPDRTAATLAPWFHLAGETVHTHQLSLPRTHVRALVEMGPSAPHTDPAALARAVAALPEPLPVTASIRLTHWRPAASADQGKGDTS